MSITDAKLRNLKPRDKAYRVSDANGLYVQVSITGARLWRYNYRFAGKQRTLALGVYPAVGLQHARKLLADAKVALADGIDPADAKRKHPLIEGDTFEALAERWFLKHRSKVGPATFERDYRKVQRDVFPDFGHRVASTITPKDVVAVIRKIESRGALAAARRIRGKVSQIFRFGVGEGILTHDPSRDIDEALAAVRRQKRHASLPAKDLPAVIARVRAGSAPEAGLALLLAMHTAHRTQPLLRAEWSEIEDLDGREPTWRVPAHKMKIKDVGDHLTPLSRQAVAILKAAQVQMPGHGAIFHINGKPLHNGAMIAVLYALGYQGQTSVHGFRHAFSTWANESGYNSDHIERSLAHIIKGVRGVYNAAEWLPERRVLMQAWSDFIEPPASSPFDDLL